MGMGGDLIRLSRKKAGLSQRQLAERAGTSASAIAFYENGHRDPTVETLRRVCRAAGWDVRMRLDLPDLYSESLEQVLREHFDRREVAAWRKRDAAETAARRRSLGLAP